MVDLMAAYHLLAIKGAVVTVILFHALSLDVPASIDRGTAEPPLSKQPRAAWPPGLSDCFATHPGRSANIGS
jgi:hypothetical protein